MIEYRQSIREEEVRLIEKNIREPADEIGALISEYIKDFDVTEQERSLGWRRCGGRSRGCEILFHVLSTPETPKNRLFPLVFAR